MSTRFADGNRLIESGKFRSPIIPRFAVRKLSDMMSASEEERGLMEKWTWILV